MAVVVAVVAVVVALGCLFSSTRATLSLLSMNESGCVSACLCSTALLSMAMASAPPCRRPIMLHNAGLTSKLYSPTVGSSVVY